MANGPKFGQQTAYPGLSENFLAKAPGMAITTGLPKWWNW